MIKSITVTNHLGESITIELRRPEKSGFLVRNIQGLGPSKATINSTELSTMDGARYNSARVTSRNIVLTLGFLFNPTIEHMRQLSYKYFPLKKPIRLTIETDNRTTETYGYVESNEPDIFSAQESTVISIMCPDPYLRLRGNVVTVFSGIESLFEFPFSNESLTEDLLEMSSVKNDTLQTINYDGDAETGVVMTIRARGPVTNIVVYNVGTREEMKIDTTKIQTIMGSPVTLGDDIIISTVSGAKYARLLRNGVYTNILNAIDKDADWFVLSKGDNMLAYMAETGVDNLEFQLEHQVLYEGV